MSIHEPLIQTTRPSSSDRPATPPTASTQSQPLWQRLLRWRIRSVPPTHEQHHHRRLLEIARREREAEVLRQTATAPGSLSIH